MFKFFKYILTLFIIVFIIDRAFVGILDFIIDRSDIRFTNLKNEDADYYVFGNSRGVHSFNEFEFEKSYNLKTLNVSYNSLSPKEIKFLISKVDSTKKIIIEVSSFLESLDCKTDNNEKVTVFNSFKHLRNNNLFSDIFKSTYYNNELTFRALYHFFRTDKTWVNYRILNNDKLNFLLLSESNFYYDLKNYEELRKYLDQNNYDYIMYFAPIHFKLKKKILNWDKINSSLHSDLGEKYLDLSDLIFDDSGFADLVHTNHNSSLKINEEIYQFVKLNYLEN